jgi:prevent-host-death family protein
MADEETMTAVSVRELIQHTSEILRRVREEGETIDITYYGETVARLVPVVLPAPPEEELVAYWATADQLAAEIGARWPKGMSAVDALKEDRPEL